VASFYRLLTSRTVKAAALKRINQETSRELLIFSLLVAIGVAGRWGQPDWEFTPVAAAAIFAGRYFYRMFVAALVPVAILAISDLLLPAYNSWPVLFVKYSAMVMPILFGRMLLAEPRRWKSLGRWAICGIAPATLFFVTTNLAVWAFESDYAKNWAGLIECYVAAVPFYRSMLVGDLFYLTVLFGSAVIAGQQFTSRALIEERLK